METSSPAAAPATAFLFIENPEKRHEGQYICRIGQIMDVGKLIVEDRSMLTVYIKYNKNCIVCKTLIGEDLMVTCTFIKCS